jgi:putative ABC transport system permease protein
MLLKKPSFTLIAAITFALGIGVNTVIFSGVYAFLLKPLPYPDADRMVVISQVNRQDVEFGVSYPDFGAWKSQTETFERMAAVRTAYFNLTNSDPVERVSGGYVSPEFFPLMGGRAELGRTFLSEEFRPGEKVVALSYGFWQNRLGADPGVVGRAIKLDGQSYTVVGVMPSNFMYPFRAAFWTPLEAGEQPKTLQDAAANTFEVIAVMKPGLSLDRATRETEALARRESPRKSAGQPEMAVKLTRLRDTLPGLTKYRAPFLAMQFAVLFVLLIASANLANLLLARNAERRQEFTIRLALGAGRGRLIRQLLAESLLLGLLGSLLGLLLAVWGMHALRAVTALRLPGMREIEINGPVLLATLLLSLLTSLAFGLGPALMAARQDLNESLKTGATSADPHRRRISGYLVAGEVALAVALLAASGLMIRTFLNLTKEDPGFNPKHAVAVSLSLPPSQRADDESLAAYFDEAVRRIRALPGVESVGGVTYMPLVGYNPGVDFTIDGRAYTPSTTPRADIQPVTPDYFHAIGVPLLLGRQLADAEMKARPEVAVVNKAFAKKYWPDESPLGKRIHLQGDNLPRGLLTVVGVVGDVKQFGLHTDPRPEIYLPKRSQSMTLVVRAAGAPARLIPSLREAVQGLDDRAAINVRTMEQAVADSVEKRRIFAWLLGVLAAVALLMAAMGIYGVISYLVTQRTREVGIRLALGAQKRDVLKLVLGQGLTLTLIGVGAGLALALVLTRLLSNLLFGVGAADPVTFLAIASLLSAVALAASYLPARRAMKVNPITALRHK